MTESIKERDSTYRQDEETEMPKAAPAVGGMGFIFVAILMIAMFAFLPISPSMTVTFDVKTQTSYPQTTTVSVLSTSYQKISFTGYFVSERDTLLLTPTTGKPGSYALQIVVKYSGTQISSADFSDIGDGVYQLKVDYFPRSEQRDIPYQVDITLIAPGQSYQVTALVFPT